VQSVDEPPTDDDNSGSEEEDEVFDDALLNRADIPKIVEAVMSKFSNGGVSECKQEDGGSDDNPHPCKYSQLHVRLNIVYLTKAQKLLPTSLAT